MPTPDRDITAFSATSLTALVTRAGSRARAPSTTRVRAAAATVFALSGFVFGSWVARVPDVSSQVGATPTSLGVALLSLSLGALVTMQLTGALCARLGAGLVSATSGVLLCMAAVLPALVSSVPALIAVLLVFGAGTGMVNVAANSLGVHVEERLGRRVLPSLHAAFSFGGLAGALVGGAAGTLVPAAPHLLAVAAVGLALLALIAPTLLGADAATRTVHQPVPGDSAPPAAGRIRAPIVLLGAMAGATAFGEGSLADWGALHLRETLGADPAVAAAGYAGFSLAMGTGRLLGGRLISRLGGDTPLLVAGGLIAALGMLIAALSPVIATALAGFVLVGLGLANIFPLAIARAGALGGANGVALASTVGYSGLLAGPPLIGFLAEHAGLPLALASISVLAGIAALLALATEGYASPASMRAWRTAVSLGPALLRVHALAERGTLGAKRHAADLTILLDPGHTPARRLHPASDLEVLFG